MSSQESPKTLQKLPYDKEEILLFRKLITKRVHEENFVNDPEKKVIAARFFKVVNAAYDALEKDSTWDSPYTPEDLEVIAGYNNSREFKVSQPTKLGTPLGFLNKVYTYLKEKGGNVDQTKNSPTENKGSSGEDKVAEIVKQEIFNKQKADILRYLDSTVKSLLGKKIIIDFQYFRANEYSSALFIAGTTIQFLNQRIQKNNFEGLLNPRKPITLSFITQPSGTPDVILIKTSEGKEYKIEVDKNYWPSVDLLVKKINEGTL